MDRKLHRALQDLQTLLDIRLDTFGGYPAVIDVIGDCIVVADVTEEGEPELEILRTDKFLEIWQRAKAAHKRNRNGGIADWLLEEGCPDSCRR